MKIGIDIDGVLIDYESIIRVYAEFYDILELDGKGRINKNADTFQEAYEWTDEQKEKFMHKYFEKLSADVPVLPGVKFVLDYLKEKGHELIIISARGATVENMIYLAKNILDKNDLKFDKYMWKQIDKVKTCKDEKIDIMIEDNSVTCEKLCSSNIKTIYVKSAITRDLPEGEYLKQVTNWGEIFRYFKEMEDNNE